MNKKTIAIITGVSVAGVAILGVCGGFAWKNYNRFEPKQKEVTMELGTKPDSKPDFYIEANQNLLKETTLDFSEVDTDKTGTYTVTATSGKRTADIAIKVVDTTAPVITLKQAETYSILVNTELKAIDIIEKVEDKAGMKSIRFDKNQTAIQTDSQNPLDKIGLNFDTAGVQTVKITAEDNNGNLSTKELTVKVIENYSAHVSGFHDITLEQGTTVDWMEGIVKDDKIAEIIVDTSGIDTNTPGEYTLKYIIKGDDNETIIEQTVKVTVTAKPEPEPEPTKPDKKSSDSDSKPSKGSSSSGSSSNSGSASSGNKPSSGGNSGGGGSSSGGSSGGGASSGSGTPEGTYEGTVTDEGTTSSGVDAWSGTW